MTDKQDILEAITRILKEDSLNPEILCLIRGFSRGFEGLQNLNDKLNTIIDELTAQNQDLSSKLDQTQADQEEKYKAGFVKGQQHRDRVMRERYKIVYNALKEYVREKYSIDLDAEFRNMKAEQPKDQAD